MDHVQTILGQDEEKRMSAKRLPEEGDDYEFDDNEEQNCSYCGGDGWGIVGTDWDTDDAINGPYNGEVQRCPNCHGSGDIKDMTFW